MKILIIDSELLAAEKLKQSLKQVCKTIDALEIISSTSKAIKYINQNNPDLVFIDLQLSDGSDISLLNSIDESTPIIFTTTNNQYAIKALKQNSVNYLLKPIQKSDLETALNKMDSISPAGFHRIKAAMKSYFEKEESYKKRFMILSGRKIKKVDTSEIAYFYSLEKKVFIVTYQDKVFPVDYSLEELGDLLNPVEFFRINRKMLIAFKSIGNMTPYPRSRIKIDLIPPEPDDAEAVVSVDRISAFRDWLNQ